MGNLVGFCCGCLSEIIRNSYKDGILHKGLMAPDGSRISLEGMYIDCRIDGLYPDGGMEVSFVHNISGKFITSTRYVIVNNRDFVMNPNLGDVFRLRIIDDRKYVLVTEVVTSHIAKGGDFKDCGTESGAAVDSSKEVNKTLVDPEFVKSTSVVDEEGSVTVDQCGKGKSDLEIVSPVSGICDDAMEGSSVMIENFRIYDDHATTS